MFREIEYPEEPQLPVLHIDGLALVGIALALYMAYYTIGQVFSRPQTSFLNPSPSENSALVLSTGSSLEQAQAFETQAESTEVYAAAVWDAPLNATGDPYTFLAPYPRYTLTQGPHGQSYGHLAIDLAAGRGSAIYSPINGAVVEVGDDQYGNTRLVIENEVYQVLLLHGDYTVSPGDLLRAGDLVGSESNHGYTMDMAGRLCRGAPACGNHTHLNVFDKTRGENVNPLTLLGD
jgi:murein DD-endopeptidase MepM/ murein hydrolase activator NlpD